MGKRIGNIVFTKNRPLQLDGYLESLYRHFPAELIQTYILYKPELFDNEYRQLFERYSDCVVVRETDFSADLFGILNQVNTEYILFGVDDVVYFNSVRFDLIDQVFSRFSDDIFGFSLRFGEQNTRESDHIGDVDVVGQTVYNIDWTQGRTVTTRYPFELCATIYKSELVRRIVKSSRNDNALCESFFAPNSAVIKVLSKIIRKHKLLKKFGYFYNPNTLESWNCRWCQNNSGELPRRLYFQKICAAAIQVNMVNTSTENESDDSAGHTVEALNEKYVQGCRLDIDAIEKNKPQGTHVGMDYFILTGRKGTVRCNFEKSEENYSSTLPR